MGFLYEKSKHAGESGNQWTSYSDLFLSLSVIFLLLYVVASLRQGTSSVQQSLERQKLTQENEDLKQQLKVFNTLKDQYLESGASADEQKMYQDLVGHLDLLKNTAKAEKDALLKKARESERKEQELNQYQKLVQSVVSANLVAQARVKRRDVIIEKKDDLLALKRTEIKNLERDVNEKKRTIEEGESTITALNNELEGRVSELKRAYENQEISKKKLDLETARIRTETAKAVEALRVQNDQIAHQLTDASTKLVAVNTQLETTKTQLQKEGQEKSRLQQELEGAANKYNGMIENLKREYEAQRGRDQEAFGRQLRAHKLSAAARAEKEAQFKAEADRKARELGQRIAALGEKIKTNQAELAKALAQANARKIVANQIKKNFALGGIKATVDENTGDVTLDFEDQYFDTGKADLKPGMKRILEKTIPLYSKSLFEDPAIAKKITSVEIVGFASPTYQGKYVDPQSLSQADRGAVDFNLDLSYGRARSIFRYIFDTNKMTFRHQRQLLPLVKVTGRSFLAEAREGRNVASGTSVREFCEMHDCMKAQKVIIKFALEE